MSVHERSILYLPGDKVLNDLVLRDYNITTYVCSNGDIKTRKITPSIIRNIVYEVSHESKSYKIVVPQNFIEIRKLRYFLSRNRKIAYSVRVVKLYKSI